MLQGFYKILHRFWTSSIRRQLMLGIALVHAVLMSIFVYDLVDRQTSFLHQQTIKKAISLAETLAANSTPWVLSNDLIGLEELIASQSKFTDLVYAMVISPRGQVLGHSDQNVTGRYVSDEAGIRLLRSEMGIHLLGDNKHLVDVAAAVESNGRLIGWARVGLDQQENLAGLKLITFNGVVYTLLAIGVGILFALVMAAGLTRGLHHLVEVSSGVRKGNRTQRSVLDRPDELGRLSDDFNQMLDALQDNEDRLKQAKTELKQSEERFDLAMKGSNDGLWDWDVRNDIVYFSPRWKAMLGYAEEEIGNSEREWSQRVHPEDLAKVNAAIQAHMRGEAPLYVDVHRVQHRDGSYRWHLERGIVVRDKRGAPYRMVGTNTDITAQKEAEDALFEEKERALVTLNSIGDGVITTDKDGFVTFLNPVAEELTGWSNQQAIGKPLVMVFSVIDEETREPNGDPVAICLEQGTVTTLPGRLLLVNKKGIEIAIEESSAPIKDRDGEDIGVVIVFHDESLTRDMEQQLSWQASHDALTGLYNRREFERRLRDVIQSARRRRTQHAVLYMDLDQFKVVNDTCGHVAGDELLRQLSMILQDRVRESDTLARLGGDEFGVLLAGCPLSQAEELANELRKVVKEFRFTWEGKSFDVGVSIGLVMVSQDNDNISSILSAADVACYAAKDKGRNRIHLYEPDDQELSQRRGEMQWVARINEALEADRFVLYCQQIAPITKRHEGEVHYEVLVRMRDERGDLIPPNAFIPAAERYNLMPALDRWVIRKSLGTMADYLATANEPRLDTLSINLSGNTICAEGVLEYVREQLREFVLPADKVCFEITETAAISNLSEAVHFMRELKRDGCRFSLDDFGSGLSSFAYLKNLPVDYLKIDGSFVRDLVDDPIDRAMVHAINEVGHVMGIRTIAEFVENDEILSELLAIGVDYAQGYGISKPTDMQALLLGEQTQLMDR